MESLVLDKSYNDFKIPASCPFTISNIHSNTNHPSLSWLIREHDEYGEYPHIYAKLCIAGQPQNTVIVLSDTGCGTEVANSERNGQLSSQSHPKVWNIRTFLEYTINPKGLIPYLVMTTHCHFDHILGIGKLPPTKNRTDALHKEGQTPPSTQVLTSAKGHSFVTPYSNLQKHSLCSSVGQQAPHYAVTTWAYDFMKVSYTHPNGISNATNIKTIHTPGHTPDSLSWYDSDLQLLCVGDSFYTKESHETRNAPWGPEPPLPTIFELKSDLRAWWGQMGKLLGFVRHTNQELQDAFMEQRPDEDETADGRDEHYVLVDESGHDGYVDSDVWCEPDTEPETVQTGFGGYLPHRFYDAETSRPGDNTEAWLLLNVKAPRVKLCAAHTTVHLDAEHAIQKMTNFMAAVLRGDVPSKRTDDGARGEETWLWDHALDGSSSEYSVVAPLTIIDEGRASIPESQWLPRTSGLSH